MDYLLCFLDGMLTFVSPCLLPMLPIYAGYFAAGMKKEDAKGRVLVNALGFVLGFTIMFVLLGVLAGQLGFFLVRHKKIINIIFGLIVIVFGLSFLGVFTIPMPSQTNVKKMDFLQRLNLFSSILFGIIFAISWTPCVTVYLSAALTLASNRAHRIEGGLLLLSYSLGLGIPMVIFALLLEKLKFITIFIKKHYGLINKISGIFLIIVGICMAMGWLDSILRMFS